MEVPKAVGKRMPEAGTAEHGGNKALHHVTQPDCGRGGHAGDCGAVAERPRRVLSGLRLITPYGDKGKVILQKRAEP